MIRREISRTFLPAQTHKCWPGRVSLDSRWTRIRCRKDCVIAFLSLKKNLVLFWQKAPDRLAIFRQCSCFFLRGARLAASQSSKSWPGGRCVHRWYSLLIWLGWGDRDAWTICHLRTASLLLINWANIRWRHQTFTQKCTHSHTHTHTHYLLFWALADGGQIDSDIVNGFIFVRHVSCQTDAVRPLHQQAAGDNTLERRQMSLIKLPTHS